MMASYAVQGLPPHTFSEVNNGGMQSDATVLAAKRLWGSPELEDGFRLLPADSKFAIVIWQSEQDAGRKDLVGAAAVSIDRKQCDANTPGDHPICFNIHGFGARNRALAHALYQLMDEAAWERGQFEYVRRRIAGEVVVPSMQFELLEGSCRTRPKALLFVANGWQLWSLRMNMPCRITEPANDTWDPGSIGPHAPEDTSCLFDLELRAPTRPLNTGYVYPTMTASTSQPANVTGMPAYFKVVGPNRYNHAIREGTVVLGPSLLYPSMQTGIFSFVVPASTCRALEEFICNSNNHGYTETYDSRFLQVGTQKLYGFSFYDNVQAPAGHDLQLQAALTFRTLTPRHVTALLDAAPGFGALASDVFQRLGYANPTPDDVSNMLVSVHFFCVDSSRQTSFDWHTDDTDLNLKSHTTRAKLRSAVIQLGAEGCTAMQMHGFDHCHFQGRGSGAIFHGAAVHRSVNCVPSPKHGIWKVTLFIMLPE
jgi:hypothetical protein